MSPEVVDAVLRVQTALMSGRLNPWRTEQAEEALDALLRFPERGGDPFHLLRNAMSDARKKLTRRAQLMLEYEEEEAARRDEATGPDAEPLHVLAWLVRDVVDRSVGPRDRAILEIANDGGGAAEVAGAMDISYDVAKVRLSRARQRARDAWEVA